LIIYGPPGIGKSSLAGNIPKAVAMPFKSENTWGRLKEAGTIPADLPVLPAMENWVDVMAVIDELTKSDHDYKVLLIDTAFNQLERLCHVHVCEREFGGNWGERGFAGYQRGYDTSLADWRECLHALDDLRDLRGMTVVMLGHSKVAPHRDPRLQAFDRLVADCHHKTWGLSHGWADAVFHFNYEIDVDDSESRPKGRGGNRVLYTEWHPGFDAKNRFNLESIIDAGKSGAEAWKNLSAAFVEAKKDD
jgi:hypothetical protein